MYSDGLKPVSFSIPIRSKFSTYLSKLDNYFPEVHNSRIMRTSVNKCKEEVFLYTNEGGVLGVFRKT